MSESDVVLLPKHGQIACRRCWTSSGSESEMVSTDRKFKLVNDPAAWGSQEPRYLILGITKGNTQSGAMSKSISRGDFDLVAYKEFRDRLTMVLHKVGLAQHVKSVDSLIQAQEKVFGWGSVVRCSLTGWNKTRQRFTGESGKVLPAFNHPEMSIIVRNCVSQFLSKLPARTEIIVFLGNDDGYMNKMQRMVAKAYGSDFSPEPQYKGVSYFAGGKQWVHVGHPSKGNGHFAMFMEGDAFSVQGEKRELAKQAIRVALDRSSRRLNSPNL
jgi:hypothetical protein